MTKIAIIGAGNMGGAIARGLLKSGVVSASDITVSDTSEKALHQLRTHSGQWRLTVNNQQAVTDADVIILAVKPWLIDTVAAEISAKVDYNRQIVVSVAAGVDFFALQKAFAAQAILFRLIPNTAIDVMESVTTITSLNASDEQRKLICDLFEPMGKVFYVDSEAQLDAYMSLSSCGIAYALRYIRAATQGGVELGIYPEKAKEAVVQTLKGAVALLEANHSHPEAEIDKVTTPGGITIRGLNEMEACGFSNAVIRGLKKSGGK